ncbi:hypothetical protein LB467_12120 [Salegentibacter sp. JZCK2]|uniref:hypothetical protein n=1 Tax=Salegentibacter tibetensis TaxID=2873600 RepID=UPI001CCB5B2B|nr:hypothetical protein [Salegentibacter tibetensis]MBZ9730432.1 hypothetical protein [Salegentibacter tibetensis]
MDTASTLIGLGLLALFVLPILLLIWQQNTNEKNRLKTLKEIGSKNNLDTDTVEVSATLFLGLDSKSKKLLVIEPNNNMQHRVLDLLEIKNTKVSTLQLAENRNYIRRISLDLSGNSQDKKLSEIIFYDEDDNENNNASERLIAANRWNQIITEKLSA